MSNTEHITNLEDNWDLRLLGDLIKISIQDYLEAPLSSRDYRDAKNFLFTNAKQLDKNNLPLNDLDFYINYTKLNVDFIRKNIPKRNQKANF